jgi:enamine deaminase RidA (YjgF/YER057c/UK114 family)
MEVERALDVLGLTLPEPNAYNGDFIRPVEHAGLLHMPGHSGWRLHQFRGKLGRDLTVEQGFEAARYAILACLAAAKRELGDLDRIERVVRVTGFLNAVEGFREGGAVLNGASEVLFKVWGARGQHARSAIGVATLNDDWPLEIEVTFAVKPNGGL